MSHSKSFQIQQLLPVHVGWLQTCHRSWSCLILCILELINRSLPEGNQTQRLDRLQWWPELLEHPADLKISTFFLAPRTGFRAIKLMTSADGCSEHNGYQSFTQFELEYLVHLLLNSSPLGLCASIFAESFSINIPLKGFSLNVQTICLVYFPNYPTFAGLGRTRDFTVIIFSIPADPFCPR